jgi:aldose 1-epimerase
MITIEKTLAQPLPKGEGQVFTLTNSSGGAVSLCNIGAGIVSIVVSDRKGDPVDVALGYRRIEDYLGDGPCMGKTPGRVANRIANARFSLNGKEYRLNANVGGIHHLHGGANGFANRIWDARIENAKVIFTLVSDDGDQGYPGTLTTTVTYEWNERNELTIRYAAVSDADTVVNLTNHAYFNLAGENSGSVLEHTLRLYASRWLPASNELITTGEIASVKGTPMDFTTAKPLGQEINAAFDALKFGKGYDSSWVVDDWQAGVLKKIAELHSDVSGITLEVLTTQPALQIYTGNWLGGSPESKSGRSYNDYDGVAMECQNFPDAPNKPAFPSAVLRKGERYEQSIVFKFS